MSGMVTIATNFWSDSADWPKDAKMLYLWAFTNQHVNGLSGVGQCPDSVMTFETGLATRELKKAQKYLQEQELVMWCANGWYFVQARMFYTCLCGNGAPNAKLVTSVHKYLLRHKVPVSLMDALRAKYGYLFSAVGLESPESVGEPISVKDGDTTTSVEADRVSLPRARTNDPDPDSESESCSDSDSESSKPVHDIYGGAFREAYEKQYLTPYLWVKEDFITFARWWKGFKQREFDPPDVETFIAVCKWSWAGGDFSSGHTLRAVCSKWTSLWGRYQSSLKGDRRPKRGNTGATADPRKYDGVSKGGK